MSGTLGSWADAIVADMMSPESQERDAAVNRADEIRSETSDASDAQPSQSDESVLEQRWWVNQILDSARRLGFLEKIEEAKAKAHSENRLLQVLSCCSGCCAETEVLKAGGWAIHVCVR